MPGDWMRIYINWNPYIEGLVQALGEHIEAQYQAWEDGGALLIRPNLRNADGEYNVSSLCEGALSRLGRDMAQLTADQWEDFHEQYAQMRDQMDQRRFHLTPEGAATIDAIVEQVKKRGFNDKYLVKDMRRGVPNRRLVITIALMYCHHKYIGGMG